MQRCQEGEAGAHSDAHTGTQAHAQKLMFRHEAAAGPEPEKHTHGPGLRREQADAARLTAAWGLLPVPPHTARRKEEAASAAGTLAPEQGLNCGLRGDCGPPPPPSLRLL